MDNWYDVIDVVCLYNICIFIGGYYYCNCFFLYDGILGIFICLNLCDKNGLSGYSIFDIILDFIIIYE